MGADQDGRARGPDDLVQGHVTQVWLAASDDAEADVTGMYWYHQQLRTPTSTINDVVFQVALLGDS